MHVAIVASLAGWYVEGPISEEFFFRVLFKPPIRLSPLPWECLLFSGPRVPVHLHAVGRSSLRAEREEG